MKSKTKNTTILKMLITFVMMISFMIPAKMVSAAEEGVVNNTFDTAIPLKFNTTIADELSASDTKRYYKFSIAEAGVLKLGFTFGAHPDRTVRIYDNMKTEVDEWYISHSNWNYEFSNDTLYLTGGDYYMEVDTECTYSFVATMDTLSESFKETQDNDNNIFPKANEVGLSTKYKGILAYNDDKDYYSFSIPVAGQIYLNLNNVTSENIKYAFYDDSKNGCYIDTVEKGDNLSSKCIPLAPGTYYFAVSGTGVGSYTFSMDYVMAVPSIKEVESPSYSNLSVSWGEVAGAAGYELWYAKSMGFTSGLVKNEITNAQTTAAYSGLSAGNYYVKVRAYIENDGERQYTGFSSVKSAAVEVKSEVSKPTGTVQNNISKPEAVKVNVKKPVINSVKNSPKKKITIKWRKVTGISGYELQYSTNSKFKSSVSKKKISKSKGSSTYSRLKKGKKYYVRMRAYKNVKGKKYYSKWSNIKSVKIKR